MTTESDIIECVVHTIQMSDVEDPDLFVADPIWKWQQTEEGKWIMEHSKQQPMWKRNVDNYNYGYVYTIHAWLDGQDLTYWKLKYE
jgi:hypothetical protein